MGNDRHLKTHDELNCCTSLIGVRIKRGGGSSVANKGNQGYCYSQRGSVYIGEKKQKTRGLGEIQHPAEENKGFSSERENRIRG